MINMTEYIHERFQLTFGLSVYQDKTQTQSFILNIDFSNTMQLCLNSRLTWDPKIYEKPPFIYLAACQKNAKIT